MLKRFAMMLISFLTFFYLGFGNVYAYEYIDSSNEPLVIDMIRQVYDSKEQYEDLVGGYDEVIDINSATSSSYWWPIGSRETVEVDGKLFANGDPETVYISSEYGYREDPFGRGTLFHSGLDIAGAPGYNVVNVIAARDGVVVYPTADVKNNCPSGSGMDPCGGGYGNYVVIQHSDGNYTLYAHLHENSITVKAGDSVRQGQVIAKVGSSGYSTGAHLHFEVREGENAYKATVNPLNYISADNPRIVSTGGGEFLSWLNSWEGSTPKDGDYYTVVNIGDGVRTVGSGVTLEYNASSFAKYGINVNDYPEGSKIPISIVDQIELEIVANKRSYIENILSENSITLKENEIEALISQAFNTGNISGFADAYTKYGNTIDFYNNWFFRAVMKGSIFEAGLTRRRNAEWSLFNIGEYVYNG